MPVCRSLHVCLTQILLLLLLHASISFLFAQGQIEYSNEVEELFQNGLVLYARGDARAALSLFEEILNEFPLNQRTTAAYIMNAKGALVLREYDEAERTLKKFLATYPRSSYAPDAYYMLGIAELQTGGNERAVKHLLEAWRSVPVLARESKLYKEIFYALDRAIDNHLTIVAVQRLLQDSKTAREREYLLIKTAEKEIANGNVHSAESILDSLSGDYTPSAFPQRIGALRQMLYQRKSVKLGVLLPLFKNTTTPSENDVGNEIFEGVTLALEGYPQEPTKVILEVLDTEHDPLIASRVVQSLTDNPDVIGIIGPVFSNTTSAVVGLTNVMKVPLVTPTANANGIAASGSYVFQANPDYETRGRAMAQYAVTHLGYTRLAVMAPIDTYAKYLADAFIAEARELGAEVLAAEWYQRGEADFQMQLMNIRRTAMSSAGEPFIVFDGTIDQRTLLMLTRLGVRTSTLDSLVAAKATVSGTVLLGPHAKTELDSLGIPVVYEESRIDSLEYPVTGVQAIYLPISSPEEIGTIPPQLAYYNFHVQILGSGEWNNFPYLDANKRYCKGAIFDSDNYIDADRPEYKSFFDRFYARFKKRPTKYTLFGYDTARLILDLIRRGAGTRELLRNALAGIASFEGLHSRIGFSERRVNTWLSILKYSSDSIQKINELNVE